MDKRGACWSLFLAGLPLSPFLFRPHLDLWHSQTTWAHIGLIVLFGLWLWGERDRRDCFVSNKPLAVWITWIGLFSIWTWTETVIRTGMYPVPMLQGIMHCLLIVLFYVAATGMWTSERIEGILKAVACSGVIVLAYCLLQLAGLDQFLKDTQGQPYIHLVGTLGNPSHLGTYLALLLPIFLLQAGWFWKSVSFLDGMLIIATGSASAIGSAILGVCLLLCFTNWKAGLGLLAISVVCGILTLIYYPNLIDPNGRLEAWGEFFKIFKLKPITGLGTGFIMEFSRENKLNAMTNPTLFRWRHVHNEFFQVAIEQGVIGLGVVLWAVADLTRKVLMLPKSPLLITLSSVFLVFCLNALMSYPAHLWVTGSLGLLAYCGIYSIYREDMAWQH